MVSKQIVFITLILSKFDVVKIVEQWIILSLSNNIVRKLTHSYKSL